MTNIRKVQWKVPEKWLTFEVFCILLHFPAWKQLRFQEVLLFWPDLGAIPKQLSDSDIQAGWKSLRNDFEDESIGGFNMLGILDNFGLFLNGRFLCGWLLTPHFSMFFTFQSAKIPAVFIASQSNPPKPWQDLKMFHLWRTYFNMWKTCFKNPSSGIIREIIMKGLIFLSRVFEELTRLRRVLPKVKVQRFGAAWNSGALSLVFASSHHTK